MDIKDTDNIVCFYHSHCVDGTTAAAVVLKRYANALAFPVSFEKSLEDIQAALPKVTPDTTVIFVDTSFGLGEVSIMAKKVLVIDHHLSEKPKIEALAEERKNIEYIFNNAESGASLAFQNFFPEEKIPTIIAYVKDIDLWENKFLSASIEAHIYLSLFKNQPEKIKDYLQEDVLPQVLKQGHLLKQYSDAEISVISE